MFISVINVLGHPLRFCCPRSLYLGSGGIYCDTEKKENTFYLSDRESTQICRFVELLDAPKFASNLVLGYSKIRTSGVHVRIIGKGKKLNQASFIGIADSDVISISVETRNEEKYFVITV